MNSPKDVALLDLESSKLELLDDVVEGHRGIGSGENVPGRKGRRREKVSFAQGREGQRDSLVHEQSPDEVLKLPHGSNTSDLEDEGTVVIEEVVDLLEEGSVSPEADVLEERGANGRLARNSGEWRAPEKVSGPPESVRADPPQPFRGKRSW